MGAATWCGRGVLWFLLVVLFVLGIAAAAIGGASLGTAQLINTSSLEFAQAVLLLIGGLFMILGAILLIAGACGGTRRGLLAAKICIIIAALAMLAAAICGTVAYTRFQADPPGVSQNIWNNLIPGAQNQYQALIPCYGWQTTPNPNNFPGCAPYFQNWAYYTIYGAMIGSWVCFAICIVCLLVAFFTWRSLKKDKIALKEQADAEKAAAVAAAAAKPVYVQAAPSPVYSQPSGASVYATQPGTVVPGSVVPGTVVPQTYVPGQSVVQTVTPGQSMYMTQPTDAYQGTVISGSPTTGTTVPQPTGLYSTTTPMSPGVTIPSPTSLTQTVVTAPQ